MTDWDAVREHLAVVVMNWHRGDGKRHRLKKELYNSQDYRLMQVWEWCPDKSPDQFFQIKDAMRERGWFWHGWEDESGANVQYWKPGEFHIEYGKDLMQANALAAAEATGYESE